MERRICDKFGISVFAAFLVISASLCVSTVAQAKIGSCASDYKKHYLKGPTHKAMAVTGGRSPLGRSAMSCGTAWGYATKKQAIREALRQCRATDRKYRDPGVCKIIGVK
jgi:hypothetical protein